MKTQMFNSLRSQLFIIFILFSMLSALASIFTFSYFDKKAEIIEIENHFNKLKSSFQSIRLAQENFYRQDLIDTVYYHFGDSYYTKASKENSRDFQNEWSLLMEKSSNTQLNFSNSFQRISTEFNSYISYYEHLKKLLHTRGFKNYGIEGKMRTYAHQLEDNQTIPLKQVLQLRRHEKDFIIRQDIKYVTLFNILVNQISKLNGDNDILYQYASSFNKFAELEQSIGLKTNTGLTKQINEQADTVNFYLKKTESELGEKSKAILYELQVAYSIIILSFIFISIVGAIILSKRISKRISVLSNGIAFFVDSNFTMRSKLNVTDKKDEISKLVQNVQKLEEEIVSYINLFKEKVDEKTAEILIQKTKIEEQNNKIVHQHAVLEAKNKDITDSLRYARRIQQALMPSKENFDELFNEYAYIFQPKDIVSGDSIWVSKVNGQLLFASIDCTGHGVPGAFISILAINSLNEAVKTNELNPANILSIANDIMYYSLKHYKIDKTGEGIKDGMDISLCSFNPNTKVLNYAGANNSIFILSKEERIKESEHSIKVEVIEGTYITELKPNKLSIGAESNIILGAIQNQTIQLENGDCVFQLSDGYVDQFGGARGKKFKKKQLKELLAQSFDLKLSHQQNLLERTISKWMEGYEQVDDISLFAIRV
ncbi:SpoIIE family protein phosphatase [bacterium]|nr:SpoIIE family protein phosphatase [bacterium]